MHYFKILWQLHPSAHFKGISLHDAKHFSKGYLMTSRGYRILTLISKGEPAARPTVHTGMGQDSTVVTGGQTKDRELSSATVWECQWSYPNNATSEWNAGLCQLTISVLVAPNYAVQVVRTCKRAGAVDDGRLGGNNVRKTETISVPQHFKSRF